VHLRVFAPVLVCVYFRARVSVFVCEIVLVDPYGLQVRSCFPIYACVCMCVWVVYVCGCVCVCMCVCVYVCVVGACVPAASTSGCCIVMWSELNRHILSSCQTFKKIKLEDESAHVTGIYTLIIY